MNMFSWDWKLSDGYPAPGVPKRGLRVFTTFACGGGSTMGYKLAGYEMVGANDIDPEMARVYKANHNPKLFFECPIGDLLNMETPEELKDLDVLDGSPPCSTFSMAGDREKAWKKDKVFREGQAKQVLSDLFFDFIALTAKLKPKVVIAENVRGMLVGNAKAYTSEVLRQFDLAGYQIQLFSLDGSKMGVPQRRQRVFFIGTRKDLAMPLLHMAFGDKEVPLGEVLSRCSDKGIGKTLSEAFAKWWRMTPPGKNLAFAHPKGSFFNSYKQSMTRALTTIAATKASCPVHPSHPVWVSDEALILCGTFPKDYNFVGVDPQYLIGMSVPPVMMARVADEVAKQLFKK